MAMGHCGGFHHKTLKLPIGPLPRHALVGMDMGGSLVKVAYIQESHKNETSIDIAIELVTFSIDHIDDLLNFLQTDVLGVKNSHKKKVYATGVGSVKYKEQIEDRLSVELIGDCLEMKHAVEGLNFLWQIMRPEHLLYPESETKDLSFESSIDHSGLQSGMLINIGSALSIVQMLENNDVRYIGGGITAGHTFLGLGALLLGTSNFDDLHQLAEAGNRSNVDLYVKDTAGSSYNFAPSNAMVSSFGRVAKKHSECPDVKFSHEDLAASLLHNIVDQIAATSYLVGKGENITTAVFCGSFLANSQLIRQKIKLKLQECSAFLQHEMKPVFVRYEHYLGAIGTLLSYRDTTASTTSIKPTITKL